MSARPKRQRGASEPVDPKQQDLFASFAEARKAALPTTSGGVYEAKAPKPCPPAALLPPRMKLAHSRPSASNGRAKIAAPPVQPAPPSFGADDWWTTRAVCGFLKIGRKALWNMRRDPACDFPAPVDAVGHRHLYLAAEVRAWMDARRERARQRAEERRQALSQFSSRSS